MNKIKLKLADAEVRTAEKVQRVRSEPNNLAQKNPRTLLQALLGCRKNCQECREEEKEWELKIDQKEAPHA